MIRLEYMEASGEGYRHRTWTKIGEDPWAVSALQNQFALAENDLAAGEAVQQFRRWLWREVKDPYNVVSTELRRLARAHQAGQTVAILAPKDAPHGAVIVRALAWLAATADLRPPPRIHGTDPGPCYEPILPDGAITTRADFDPNHLVWITGKTQSRIGVIVAYGQAFVPEYGVVPLKHFRWVKRSLARHPTLQRLLNDAFDQAFAEEADATPVAYDPAPAYRPDERFAEEAWFWEPTTEEHISSAAAIATAERDALTLVEQLMEEIGDVETALTIAQSPEMPDWDHHPLPHPACYSPETMRPVYRYQGENAALMVKTVEEQIQGKRFRYATREEAEAYRQTFRSPLRPSAP
jgi:hypothetical protein